MPLKEPRDDCSTTNVSKSTSTNPMINTISERNALMSSLAGSPFARFRSILENTAVNSVRAMPEAKPAMKFDQKLLIVIFRCHYTTAFYRHKDEAR